MKLKIYSLLFVLLFFFGVLSVYAIKQNDLILLGKVIYLDAGHGGVDGGAQYKDIYEKDINLEITLKLEKKLSELGAIVYLTRSGDYDLADTNAHLRKRSDLSNRSKLINESSCDLYLSIHLNSEATGVWRGPQIFYDDVNSRNEDIALIFQKELNKSLKGDRETKQSNNLYLEKNTLRPGVLVEVGFLSNANERYLLKTNEYQYKIVDALTNATITYFTK